MDSFFFAWSSEGGVVIRTFLLFVVTWSLWNGKWCEWSEPAPLR